MRIEEEEDVFGIDEHISEVENEAVYFVNDPFAR